MNSWKTDHNNAHPTGSISQCISLGPKGTNLKHPSEHNE